MNAKKILVVVGSYALCAALLVVLWLQVFDNVDDYAADTLYSQVEDLPEIPLRMAFTGNPAIYEFIWEYGRERYWEEDIIYFAVAFLNNHPLLNSNAILYFDIDSLLGRGSNLPLSRRSFIDVAVLNEFLLQINQLVPRLPYLEDFEINGALMRISAILNDSHTYVLPLNPSGWLPLHIAPHTAHRYYDGLFPTIYPHIHRVCPTLEQLLGTRIIAMNDMSFAEIFQRVLQLRGIENDVHFPWHEFFDSTTLAYICVMEYGDPSVTITGIDNEGNIVEAEVHFLDEFATEDMLIQREVDYETSFFRSRANENYWYQFFYDENMLYVRFLACFDMPSNPSSRFWQGIIDLLEAEAGVDTFVLDLRNNIGGHFLMGFGNFATWASNLQNQELLGRVYIIVNHITNSNGTNKANTLHNVVNDAILIGQPTGGAKNFFASEIHHGETPNFGVSFIISRGKFELAPDLPPDVPNTLIPDILIFRTLEDFANSHDPIMEAIRTGIYRTE